MSNQPIFQDKYPDLIHGRWNDGLCDCFSNVWPSCICSFCCPCVIICQLLERFHYMDCCCFWVLFVMTSGLSTAVYGIGSVYLPLVLFGLSTFLRGALQIEGGCGSDFMFSTCCFPCHLARISRHVYRYSKMFDEYHCGYDGRPTTPTYTTNAAGVQPILVYSTQNIQPMAYSTQIAVQNYPPQYPQGQMHQSYPVTAQPVNYNGLEMKGGYQQVRPIF